MASYQYYSSTNGQPQYDTAYSTSAYNPGITTETYVEETYDSYGNKVVIERKNYSDHGHQHGAIGHGYGHSSNGSYGHGYHDSTLSAVLGRTHQGDSFGRGTTYSGHHHKGHPGSHGSGRTHRARLFRKKREDGHSDSDSYSDSDHE